MPVLRMELFQPQAHYRVPYTLEHFLTYPIPPYSTVLGFLANLLGIDDQNKEMYQFLRDGSMSIAGRFETKLSHYLWFRSLDKKHHVKRYGHETERCVDGYVAHPGGQIPVIVDELLNQTTIIHFYHPDKELVEKIKQELLQCNSRLDVLHLGRSEDLVALQELKIIDETWFEYCRADGWYPYFFWIPLSIFIPFDKRFESGDHFQGMIYRISHLSKIDSYEALRDINRNRTYSFMEVKLNDGKIIHYPVLMDKEKNIPVFFASFGKN